LLLERGRADEWVKADALLAAANCSHLVMSTSPKAEYKPTLFDRHGPDGGLRVQAFAYGLMVFGLTIPLFAAAAVKLGLTNPWLVLLFIAGGSVGSALVTYMGGLHVSNAVGESVKAVTISGASTPYVDQCSYQQALVMRGKVDEALESYEAVIAENPTRVDVRIRAAELYLTKKGDARRAAELFREAQRISTISVGDDVYVTNRLVDLYTGPLGAPGRALVELRRLIDRYPTSPAAARAREVLKAMKADWKPDGGQTRLGPDGGQTRLGSDSV
jgi:tetratricopeptide (TPR) repeat protein